MLMSPHMLIYNFLIFFLQFPPIFYMKICHPFELRTSRFPTHSSTLHTHMQFVHHVTTEFPSLLQNSIKCYPHENLHRQAYTAYT